MHFEKFSSFVAEYSSKLSLSGMFVVTRDPRPIGSEVAFDLKLADGFRLVHGHGEVAWVRLHDGGRDQPPGMALRFIALDERGRELVLKVLEEQVKAGGLPFEIDPPPADAILEFGGAPPPAAPAFGQRPLPLEGDFAEEPTLVGRRRSLDETGFDAPWGQKLPEVPTDLLEENDATPNVPSVSEVQFAPLNPPAPVAPRAYPAAAPAAAGGQSGLFAAAYPSLSAGGESPADLGFVLDENPAPAAPPSAAPSATGFAFGGGRPSPPTAPPEPSPFAGTIAGDEDPLVDFEPAPGDAPYELDAPLSYDEPAYDEPAFDEPGYAEPAFDSEEPTMIGSARGGEAPAWGAGGTPSTGGGSRMPEAGIFAFDLPEDAAAPPAHAPAAPQSEPWSPSGAPAWEDPVPAAAPAAAPAGGRRAAKPSLFDSWQAPAAAPADPFAAPADPFSTAAADAYLAVPRADTYPAPEAYQPFDLGRSSNDLYDAAEGFGLGSPAVPPASYEAARSAPFEPAAPSIFPAGYFPGEATPGEAAPGGVSAGPGFAPGVAGPPFGGASGEAYDPAEGGWPEEEAPPTRGQRIQSALLSRKAILGLAATAILVTGAYFLAGDLLGPDEPAPAVAASRPAQGRPPARERPVRPEPVDPSAPERIVAQPGAEDLPASPEGSGQDAPAAAPPAGGETLAETVSRAAPQPQAPEPAPPTSVPQPETSRAEPAPAAPSASAARWLEGMEVRQEPGQTVVDLFFDGELDASAYRHDRLEYGKRDREMITFSLVEGNRGPNRNVGSPELTAVNCGVHPDGLHVVFVRPVGARIGNITPEGKRLRVVLVR